MLCNRSGARLAFAHSGPRSRSARTPLAVIVASSPTRLEHAALSSFSAKAAPDNAAATAPASALRSIRPPRLIEEVSPLISDFYGVD
jgi:hypothetical protein